MLLLVDDRSESNSQQPSSTTYVPKSDNHFRHFTGACFFIDLNNRLTL